MSATYVEEFSSKRMNFKGNSVLEVPTNEFGEAAPNMLARAATFLGRTALEILQFGATCCVTLVFAPLIAIFWISFAVNKWKPVGQNHTGTHCDQCPKRCLERMSAGSTELRSEPRAWLHDMEDLVSRW